MFARHSYELVAITQDAPNPSAINQISVIDVGDPIRPQLLTTPKVPFGFYSGLTLGDRIYLGAISPRLV